MYSLTDYLREALPARREERRDIRATAKAVLGSFTRSFDSATKTFPYAVRENEPLTPAADYSFSTNAMVICALRCVVGDFRSRAEIREVRYDTPSLLTPMLVQGELDLSEELQSELRTITEEAITKLKEAVATRLKTGEVCYSRTFGTNDPLTLSWLVELFHADELADNHDLVEKVKELVTQRLKNPDGAARLVTPKHESSPHALTLLRSIHAYQRLRQTGNIAPLNLKDAKRWFENSVHVHLSYADIPDSSFDAPELVFSLEGLLLCERGVHGRERLLERVLSVIAGKQEHNPNLRPYRPITSDERGMSLLPLTVEVFNSLLRMLERVVKQRSATRYQAQARPIFERYLQWLLGQRITIDANGGPVTGWHSEHTFADRLIHVWETSQVILFLAHYAAWLGLEIEHEIMATGTFSVTDPILQKYQPVDALTASSAEPDSRVQVYRAIWRHFLEPRLSEPSGAKSSMSYSALLYGPPGTGKTTFASYLAAKLGWPMITITPSDFIVSGSQLVEERAKAIFAALMELSRKVILFDEIDRLVLDRSLPQYSEQEGIFQFMTPSMLPKFADLRAAEKCVFLIATNFEERIDRAIKRRGRIDMKLLVLPPDATQRKKLIKDVMSKYGITADDAAAEWQEVIERSALHTYSELRESTKDLFRDLGDKSLALQKLAERLKHRKPDIQPNAYLSRFNKVTKFGDKLTDPIPMPDEEFRLMYEDMQKSVGGKGDKVLREIYEAISDGGDSV